MPLRAGLLPWKKPPRFNGAGKGKAAGLVIWIACACAAAGLAGSGPRHAHAAPSVLDDPRLERRITLRLTKRSLTRVLAELGSAAGVTMTARPEIADEPAIVFVRDQPVREVMRQLGELFDYRWMRLHKDGREEFQLVQDLKSRRTEEELRAREENQALADLQEALGFYSQVSRRPPEELLRMADRYDDAFRRGNRDLRLQEEYRRSARTDSILAWMLRDGSTKSVRQLASAAYRALVGAVERLNRDHWTRLAGGEALLFSSREESNWARLPEAVTRELRAAAPTSFPPGMRVHFQDPASEATSRRLDVLLAEQWAQADAYRLKVALQGRPGNPTAGLMLRVQVETVVPEKLLVGRQQMGIWPLEVRSDALAWREEPLPPEPGKDRLLTQTRLVSDPPPAPRADAGEIFNHWVAHIAEEYGLNLVADAYRVTEDKWSFEGTGRRLSLYNALNRFWGKARWVKSAPSAPGQEHFIRMRRRRWYRVRLEEVPESLVDQWEKHLRTNLALTTLEAGRLALSLRDTQLEHFPEVMRSRGWDFGEQLELLWITPGTREFARAYASLTPEQRAQLAAGKGVPLASMPAAARFWLVAAFRQRVRDEIVELPDLASAPALLFTPPVRGVIRRDKDDIFVGVQTLDGRNMSAFSLPADTKHPFVDGEIVRNQDYFFVYVRNGSSRDYFHFRHLIAKPVGEDRPPERQPAPRR